MCVIFVNEATIHAASMEKTLCRRLGINANASQSIWLEASLTTRQQKYEDVVDLIFAVEGGRRLDHAGQRS